MQFESLFSEPLRNGVSYPAATRGVGVPMVNMGEAFLYDFITNQECECVPLTEVERERFVLSEGDLLFVRQSLKWAGAGRCVFVGPGPEPRTWDSHLIRARLNPNIADSRFYFYYFRSQQGRRNIESIIEQVSAAGIRGSDLRKLTVPVPSLLSQQRIADLLQTLDQKIAVNQQTIATATSLASAIHDRLFAEALDHAETGTALGDRWRITTLREATTVMESGSRPRGGVSSYTEGVPSIGAESIVGLGMFDARKTKYVPEEFYKQMRRGVLADRDVLLYKDGGRPGEFEPHVAMFGDGFPFDRMSINEHVYRLRFIPPLSQEFGYFWLASKPLLAEMRIRGTGVAIPGLNSSAAGGLPIVVPPPELLLGFDEVASPLVRRVFSAARESAMVAQLRDFLLPKLMSGELRAGDAERVVSEAI